MWAINQQPLMANSSSLSQSTDTPLVTVAMKTYENTSYDISSPESTYPHVMTSSKHNITTTVPSENMTLFNDTVSYTTQDRTLNRSTVSVGNLSFILNCTVPVLALLSYFGNTMIVLVMCSKKNRQLASSVFFIALAISDSFSMVQVTFDFSYKIYPSISILIRFYYFFTSWRTFTKSKIQTYV